MNIRGFSEIELIVVAGLIVIISGLIAGTLYSSFQGSAKSSATNVVSQNGNQALSLISGTIVSSTSVTEIDGTPITDCSVPTPPSGQSISLLQSDGSIIIFACNNPPPITLTKNEGGIVTNLIDDTKVKVEPLSCSFTCRQVDQYSSPIIDIVFTLTQKSSTPSVQDSASSNFSTSVSLRNYNPF